MVKNLPANARDLREVGLILGSGRSWGGGNGKAFQYSCLENPMDGESWKATVHRITKNRTQLKCISTHKAIWASQVALVIKNLPTNTGDLRDTGSVPVSGRSPGGGNGNPLQYLS